MRTEIMFRWLTSLFCLMLLAGGAVSAQTGLPQSLRDVGIDQRLNEQLPLEAVFRDEMGRQVRLGDYFGSRPVILSLVYYDCPMLCTMVLNGMVRTLRSLPLSVGADFDVVTLSFDPTEGPELAAAKKEQYINSYRRPGADRGWHFLTGDEPSIHLVTEAAGFRYTYDSKTGQYAHASGIIVVTPNGKIARYLYGIEYPARDLRLALVEASANRIGSPVDQVLLYCFHYDPATGKYGLVIMNVIRVLGGATVLILATFMVVMFRRDRRRKLERHDGFPAVS